MSAGAAVGALVMAGGDGDRMRRSRARPTPKPLVEVRGASLLERNLCALLGAGLRVIWVACRAGQGEVQAEVARLMRRIGGRASVELVVEPVPLGTIGAAGLVRDRVDALLTVNADNLTALDLGAMLARHAATGADLTLAAHVHRARLDYGELCVDADRVVEYREKPVHVTRVCSAVCVLGPAALAALDGPAGLPDLTRRLLQRGCDVRAFEHEAAWIDVNDAADAARAAALVATHPDPLECWCPAPDREVVGALLLDGERVLLERRPAIEGGVWDTPGGKLEPGESPAEALARELREELGLRVEDPGAAIARFDALEPDRIVRHHVFALRAAGAVAREGQTLGWFAREHLPRECARVVARSLACLEDLEAGGASVGRAAVSGTTGGRDGGRAVATGATGAARPEPAE
ncbi:MAG TPA: NUDIX domain-containing protein [Kofleriaceae bacterium]|nr:NUDIX domain-containing protein [Kofleriaceae bacterium]